MANVRKIIEIDEERCDGCGNCVVSCAEGAIAIIDGKAKLIGDVLCDGLGACMGDCPQDALKIIEREAVDFDEEVVEKHLAKMKKEEEKNSQPLACGCSSNVIQDLAPSPVQRTGASSVSSALSHWPIKIRLVPPKAPFLNGADILVLADCAAASSPNLHNDYLAGKAVLMGCPKFDDAEGYIEKFNQIFAQGNKKSITTLIMEVPCCSGLPYIVSQGLQKSGKDIPHETIVINGRGAQVPGRM